MVQVNCGKHGLVAGHRNGLKNNHRCSVCSIERQTNFKRDIKKKSIEYKGGCCQHCGYFRYEGALEFHHKDPNVKEFNICSDNKRWDRLVKELDKCLLLCSNCHREEHERLRLSIIRE